MLENKELYVNRPGAAGDIIMTLQALDKYVQLHPETRVIYYCDPFFKDLPVLHPAVVEVRDSKEFDFNRKNSVNFVGYTETPLKRHLISSFSKELGVVDNNLKYGFVPMFNSNLKLNELLSTKFPIITLHCTAGWSPYKNWPIDKWQEVVDRINGLNKGYKVVQVGAKGDPELNNVVNLVGKSTLLESVILIKHAHLHLGVDSFSNHATALLPYTPAIILWGSTSPLSSGYGHAVNIWKPLKCAPCYKQYEWMVGGSKEKCSLDMAQSWKNPFHPCMLNITVDEVMAAVLKFIQ